MNIGITPEGTRKKLEELKTEFYFVALKANVPLTRDGFNYLEKEINIGNPFCPVGHINEDVLILS